jgi:hypothetical protein
VERKRGKCLSFSWNHISTSGIGQAEHLTPKERREREKEPPFVKSIHSVVTWKLGVVPVRRNNFPIRGREVY